MMMRIFNNVIGATKANTTNDLDDNDDEGDYGLGLGEKIMRSRAYLKLVVYLVIYIFYPTFLPKM